MHRKTLLSLVLSAMFFAMGLVLPFFTGQIQQIGNMLLPMHLPVLLCGLICGPRLGAAVGFSLPIVRSLLFFMPPLYPTAIAMAFELATYGLVVGFLFRRAKYQCIRSLYRCLIGAMICGRLVWGCVSAVLLGVSGNSFTLGAFFAASVTNAIPGVVLQLILIPAIMLLLHKTRFVPMHTCTKGTYREHA